MLYVYFSKHVCIDYYILHFTHISHNSDPSLLYTYTYIGAYMMKHYKFTAEECIGWLRIARPGCIIGPQQQWMKWIQPRMWQDGETHRIHLRSLTLTLTNPTTNTNTNNTSSSQHSTGRSTTSNRDNNNNYTSEIDDEIARKEEINKKLYNTNNNSISKSVVTTRDSGGSNHTNTTPRSLASTLHTPRNGAGGTGTYIILI